MLVEQIIQIKIGIDQFQLEIIMFDDIKEQLPEGGSSNKITCQENKPL